MSSHFTRMIGGPAIFLLLSSGAVAQRGKSLPVKDASQLVVSINSGDLRITTWEKPELLVRSSGGGSQVDVSREGETIRVSSGKRRGWERLSSLNLSIPININLDLKTRAGSIRLRGLLRGRFRGITSAGDIDLDSVEGTVYGKTSGGDIEAGRIGGDAELKTSGGDIQVRSVDGRLDAATSGGKVEVGSVSRGAEIRSSGGDIRIDAVGGDAYLNTLGGDIQAGSIKGSASMRTSGGDIEVSESVGEATARTSGGDVVLAMVHGAVQARTSGGDVRVALDPSSDGSSSLVTSGGEIRLELPAEARATVEATIHRKGYRKADVYEIHSDFQALEDETDSPRKAIRKIYRINGGGHRIVLETTNGDIRIRKKR